MTRTNFWTLPTLGPALLFALLGRPSLAAEALPGPVPADVERVIDGDTIVVRANIWLDQSLEIHVRIDGVDAPEMHARCADERRRAEAARDYLEQRLNGSHVRLTSVVYDKYGGRVRAQVTDGKGDIGAALIAKGLARPYHGERRQPWCTDT